MKEKTDVLGGKLGIICATILIFFGALLYAKGGFAQSREDLGTHWATPQEVCSIELPNELAEVYGTKDAVLVEITTMEDWQKLIVPLYVQVQTPDGPRYLYQGYIDQASSMFHYCENPSASRNFDTKNCFLIAKH